MLWTARFDHILTQIEHGHVDNAVAILSGMLDAVADDAQQSADCRSALLNHSLHSALRSPIAQPAISRLGFNRAIEARQKLYEDAVNAHQKAGLSTFVLHNSNPPTHQKYDAILAPELADRSCVAALSQHIQRLAQHIKTGGRILFSAFTRNHLGLGWRRIFLGHHLFCHDETSLHRMARDTGHSATIFQDGSGSLMWAELRRMDSEKIGGVG